MVKLTPKRDGSSGRGSTFRMFTGAPREVDELGAGIASAGGSRVTVPWPKESSSISFSMVVSGDRHGDGVGAGLSSPRQPIPSEPGVSIHGWQGCAYVCRPWGVPVVGPSRGGPRLQRLRLMDVTAGRDRQAPSGGAPDTHRPARAVGGCHPKGRSGAHLPNAEACECPGTAPNTSLGTRRARRTPSKVGSSRRFHGAPRDSRSSARPAFDPFAPCRASAACPQNSRSVHGWASSIAELVNDLRDAGGPSALEAAIWGGAARRETAPTSLLDLPRLARRQGGGSFVRGVS